MTAEQERINNIIYACEAAEKSLNRMADEFENVEYEMNRYRFIPFDLRDKVIDYYREEIERRKDEIQDIKSHLIELGYTN